MLMCAIAAAISADEVRKWMSQSLGETVIPYEKIFGRLLSVVRRKHIQRIFQQHKVQMIQLIMAMGILLFSSLILTIQNYYVPHLSVEMILKINFP